MTNEVVEPKILGISVAQKTQNVVVNVLAIIVLVIITNEITKAVFDFDIFSAIRGGFGSDDEATSSTQIK